MNIKDIFFYLSKMAQNDPKKIVIIKGKTSFYLSKTSEILDFIGEK